MTVKPFMTDNEIQRAVDCCSVKNCFQCPLDEYDDNQIVCMRKCMEYANEFIKRQKAEIESLNKLVKNIIK